MPFDDFIEKHASRVGLDPTWLRKIMRIESGGDPNQRTGSYKGLFQLSQREFQRHGGSGNIYDPEQNTMAAANKLAQEKLDFKQNYGRDPTLKDLYLVHQQGAAGYAAHMKNPNVAAWQNMLSTVEGRQKGERWAKAAIWGNLTPEAEARYGSVENVTGQNFVSEWGGKIEGTPSATMARARARRGGIPEGAGEPEATPADKQNPWSPKFYEPPVKPVEVDLHFGQFTPQINLPSPRE